MKKFLVSLFLLCTAVSAYAQTPVVWPDVISPSAPYDFGNGPLKLRVISGTAYIFTSQGSGVGSTAGLSTALTLTATPATALKPIVGAKISGTGIATGTTVAAYNGTTGITLSSAMDVAASTAISWGAACPATVGSAPYVQASASTDYYTIYSASRICGISPGAPAEYGATLPYPEPGSSSGGGGASSTFGAPFPTTGTAVGMSVGGNMVAFTGTGANLNVQCANCTGSGASAVDEAAFTAGASVFAPAGGFFQTTATNNPLTNNQQGMQQFTAQRAGFVNLRTASGVEIGTTTTPLIVNPGTAGAWGVGAAGSAVPTSASYTALNVLGTLRGATAANPYGTTYAQNFDLTSVGGSATVTGHGTAAGAIRVELPSDGTGQVNVANTVNVACTSGCSASSSTTAGTPGSTVPVSADYVGINVAGNIRGATGVNPIGSVYATQVDIASVSGSPVATGSGTASGAIRVELPTNGTGLVNANPGTDAEWGLGAIAATVPGTASYTGINVGGNLRGPTGTNPIGTVFAQQFDLAAVSGSPVVTGHGTAAGAIRVELPTDGTGSVNVGNTVNVACTSGCSASSSTTAGTPGQTVPVSANYTGVNVGGTIRGATASNPIGTVYSQQVDLAAVSGSPVVTGHGTAAGAIRVELPTDGTGAVSVSNTVNVACTSGCTAGSATTAGTPGQSVPVSADYVGLNVGGTIRGATASNPIGSVYSQQVDLAAVSGSPVVTGHGTAAGAIRVELPTDGTGAVSVSNTVNVACTSGCTAGSATTAGTPGQTVPVSADYVGVNVGGTIRGATAVNPYGTVYAQHMDLTSVGGSATVTGSGTSTGAIRVELPTNSTGVINVNPGTDAEWGLGATGAAVPASASYTGINVAGTMRGPTGVNPIGTVYSQQIDLASVSGTPVVTGNGTAAGAMRVAIASDSTVTVSASTTGPVNLQQVNGTTIVNGGVAGSQSVGGTVATNVAITANPINMGAQAISSENTAVTATRQVQLVADLSGKQIVLPYSNPENFVTGIISSSMTSTTSTSLLAAPASGLRNYITACTFSNAHATQGTDIYIQDGNGGNAIWVVPAAAVYGGAHITFPTPLRQPTTATAIYVANVTTGASTRAACNGYKGS